jgi:hypothetical protein
MTTANQSGRTTASRPPYDHPAPTAVQIANLRLLYDARGPGQQPEDRGGEGRRTIHPPKETDHDRA